MARDPVFSDFDKYDAEEAQREADEAFYDNQIDSLASDLWFSADPRLGDYTLADCGLSVKGLDTLGRELVAFLAPFYNAKSLPPELMESLYKVGIEAAKDIYREDRGYD